MHWHQTRSLLEMNKLKITGLGFTLIELMVTLALAAILMAIATPTFTSFRRNSELTSFANNMIASINAARGEAMKRGRRAMIVPTDGINWSSGWVVFVDIDFNATYNSASDVTIVTAEPPPSYIDVSGNGSAAPGTPYIMFDASGFPKVTSGGFGALTFTIERNDVSAGEVAEQTRRIIISSAGRVRTCKPSTDPTCGVSATQ